MVAYEFYWYDPAKGYELLGILPERRNDPERITKKSIMDWAEKVFGTNLSPKDMYFIQVKMNGYTEQVSRPTPFFVSQQEVKL
jgi:hypothetical protein